METIYSCTVIVIVVISSIVRYLPGTFRLHGVATRVYGYSISIDIDCSEVLVIYLW